VATTGSPNAIPETDENRPACRAPAARHASAQMVAREMGCFAAVLRSRAGSIVTMPPTGGRIIIGHPGAG
jgi:hypothetical protein